MEDGLRRKKKHPKDQVKKKSKGRKAKATKGGEENQIDEDGFLKPPKEKSKKKWSSNGLNVLDFGSKKKKKSKPQVDEQGYLVDGDGNWLLDQDGNPFKDKDEQNSSNDYSDASEIRKSRKKKKKTKKNDKGEVLSPGIFSEADESSSEDNVARKKPKRMKSNATSWQGTRLVTLRTPYGETSYIETPEMWRGKTKSNFNDSFYKKPSYISSLGGTGGGDYLQIA